MRVGIIETHYHEDFLNTLIHIFSKENVDVYTTHKIYNSLPEETRHIAKFIFYKPENSLKCFLSKIPTEQYDILFVNTIQPSMADIPNWINFKPRCKSVLTLHNLRAWHNKRFIPRNTLLHSFDSLLASRYTKRILDNYDYINVVYEPMTEKAKEFFNKKVISIPYAFAQIGQTRKKKSSNPSVLIPAICAIEAVGHRNTTHLVLLTRWSSTGFSSFIASFIRSGGTSACSVMLWLPRTAMYALTPFILTISYSAIN